MYQSNFKKKSQGLHWVGGWRESKRLTDTSDLTWITARNQSMNGQMKDWEEGVWHFIFFFSLKSSKKQQKADLEFYMYV